MTTAAGEIDPVRVIEALDPEAIRRELDDLERRERALRLLYRAAIARRRKGQRGASAKQAS